MTFDGPDEERERTQPNQRSNLFTRTGGSMNQAKKPGCSPTRQPSSPSPHAHSKEYRFQLWVEHAVGAGAACCSPQSLHCPHLTVFLRFAFLFTPNRRSKIAVQLPSPVPASLLRCPVAQRVYLQDRSPTCTRWL